MDEESKTVAKVQLKGCRAVSNTSAIHIPSLISLLVSGFNGRLNVKWLSHYATNRKVAGSIPDEVIILKLTKPSGQIRPWGSLSL
jgi:hypothetical protein